MFLSECVGVVVVAENTGRKMSVLLLLGFKWLWSLECALQRFL